MKPETIVPARQLEAAIDYLEGLLAILRRLALEKRGIEGGDPLVAEVERAIDDAGVW